MKLSYTMGVRPSLGSSANASEGVRHRWVERECRECFAIEGDVKDPEFCKRAVEETVRKFGKLDVSVNNAAFQMHAHSMSKGAIHASRSRSRTT